MLTRNETVFEQSDIVVAVTQKTINDQLQRLVDQGIIRSRLIVYQKDDDQDYHYVLCDSVQQVPPDCAYLAATVVPQVAIPQSGTNINFVLAFPEGTALLWEGTGPSAHLQQYNMQGWSYSVGVRLNFAELVRQDLNQNVKVPKLVADQLTHFMDDMFTVRHLLLDFQSVDLSTTAKTVTPGTTDTSAKSFLDFMKFYIMDETTTRGNPFILGYSLIANDQTRMAQNALVPDSLIPVGANFSLYRDQDNPDMSTLCYVLATKGGHGHVPDNPPLFDTNWIGPGENCEAKIVYSHSALLEPLLITRVFNQIREGVYNSIGGHVSVPIGNAYNAAKIVTPAGWDFVISNVNQGDDQYTNRLSVQFQNTPAGLCVAFSGGMGVYKEVSKDCFFCTARAHASGAISWTGSATFRVAADARGNGDLTVDKDFRVVSSQRDHNKNDCAKAFDWIGKILGGILDVFTAFADNGYFGDLFSDAFSVDIPGIGNLSVAIGNVADAVGNLIMLPTGQVFTLRNPSATAEGDLSLQLTYRQ